MSINLFNKNTFTVLEKSLDAVSLRQAAITDNIANVNTPYYKKKEVSFEEELKAVLHKDASTKLSVTVTHPKHIPIGSSSLNYLQPNVVVENNTFWRKDKNNVDVDVEMAEMAKNTIKYQALTQKMSGELAKLKKVIEGR